MLERQIQSGRQRDRVVTIANDPPYRQALFGEGSVYYTGPNCKGNACVEVFETHLQSICGGPRDYYVPDLSQTLGAMTAESRRQIDAACVTFDSSASGFTRLLPGLPFTLNFQQPHKIVVRL